VPQLVVLNDLRLAKAERCRHEASRAYARSLDTAHRRWRAGADTPHTAREETR
jgi:hypothetical protein